MSDRYGDRELADRHRLKILYEDNHLLVVEKPVNIPVQGDASGDEDLASVCRGYLKEAGNKPGDAYIGIVHRLDRPVGGVMVFAKTSKAAARLTSQFKGRASKKRYAAIVCGRSEPSASLTDYLVKDPSTNTSSVADADTEGAKIAKLHYDTIGRNGDRSLLDVTLETGRPHQIRVQLAHTGLPILGDQRYNPENVRRNGGAPFRRTQICLWSYALTIEHPTLGETMTFFSMPHGENWDEFPHQIETLPAFRVCRGVYADADTVVCDKNPGAEVEDELLTELSSVYGELYPVHRLDANTTGIVLFARNPEREEALTDLFRERKVKKTYRAVVLGRPGKEAEDLVHYARKNADEALVTLCRKGDPGAAEMRLSYRVLETGNGCSLVEIALHTGRTHQIRVQMAAIGCPVLGDDKYGDREGNRKYRCRIQQLLCKRIEAEGKVFESCRELSLPKQKS